MLAGFTKFLDGTKKGMSASELKQWVSGAVEAQASIELPWLDKHLVALAVISNVSTLCGLFGTVIGMIQSFTAMANAPGGVKADEMAGGIAVALVATAGGLCVAVPSLLLYNLIKGSIENYVTEIEEMAVKITDTLVE
jgi:biopolymer transport protein ExbB